MADPARLQNANAAAQNQPAKPVGSTKQPCPQKTCSALWDDANKQTHDISSISQPQDRNKKISAAYAQLYQQDHKLAWVGLASIVSRQAGCAMTLAKDASGSWIPMKSGPAGTAYKALGETNQEIFADIYPVALFYEKNGLQKLKDCAVDEKGVRHASPKLVDGLTKIDKGDPASVREGSDEIANYEQRDVIQDKIYSNQEYKDAFEKNEWWAKRPLGRMMGARPTELPLSSDCTDQGNVPFDGSISNPNDRVAYYQKLMDGFQAQSPATQNQIMQSIENQGK